LQGQQSIQRELEEEMASVEQIHQLQLQQVRQHTANLQREIEILETQDRDSKVHLAAAQVRSKKH
jgi:hypothetical protein